MCICINCRHIDKCSTYQFIEKQHNKLVIRQDISFSPISTIINVNVNKKNALTVIDWDLIECLSFVEKPGNWSD
uniref:Ycf34 n=1 Tax=Corynecladia elata TaxID=3101723 RepID=A0AA51NG76_9FLOR|nr:Ycf34 [Laurencia elata]WMP12658.1 Ycf34 [Laurencia elata]